MPPVRFRQYQPSYGSNYRSSYRSSYRHGLGDDIAAASDIVYDETEPVDELTVQLAAQATASPAPALVWPIQPIPWVRKNSFLAKYPSGKQHGALDMGKAGDIVLATAAGKVTLARDTGDARGKAVVLDLGDGWEIRHYHLDSFSVAKGDLVTQGQQIGVVGRTGLPAGSGAHLHFELRHNGAFVDPTPLLPAAGGLAGLVLIAGFAWFVLG